VSARIEDPQLSLVFQQQLELLSMPHTLLGTEYLVLTGAGILLLVGRSLLPVLPRFAWAAPLSVLLTGAFATAMPFIRSAVTIPRDVEPLVRFVLPVAIAVQLAFRFAPDLRRFYPHIAASAVVAVLAYSDQDKGCTKSIQVFQAVAFVFGRFFGVSLPVYVCGDSYDDVDLVSRCKSLVAPCPKKSLCATYCKSVPDFATQLPLPEGQCFLLTHLFELTLVWALVYVLVSKFQGFTFAAVSAVFGVLLAYPLFVQFDLPELLAGAAVIISILVQLHVTSRLVDLFTSYEESLQAKAATRSSVAAILAKAPVGAVAVIVAVWLWRSRIELEDADAAICGFA